MSERVGVALVFEAGFKANGVVATGLTITVDVRNPAGVEVVTDAAATEVGDGIYSYSMPSALNTVRGNYKALFKATDDSLDEFHVLDKIHVDTVDVSSAAVDAIWAKAMAELSAVPGVTGTVLQALSYVLYRVRNRNVITGSLDTLYKDDDATILSSGTVTDDGTTLIRGKQA